MKKYLLPQAPHTYKANLHAHGSGSDGKFTPMEMKNEFKKRGYDILCITEHEILFDYYSKYSDKDFLFLNGFELAINETHNEEWSKGKCVHLNLYAKSPEIYKQPCFSPEEVWFAGKELTDKVKHIGGYYKREFTKECVNDVIKQANENGYLVCLNHPFWSTLDARDYCEYDGLFALEIFNTDCAYWGYDSYAQTDYDSLLRSGKRLYAQMADDNHNTAKDDLFGGTFGGFDMIRASSLDYDSIIKALEKGDFYCSMAPEIDELYVENGKAKIKCSNAKEIIMSTDYRCIKNKTDKDGGLNFAEFDIPVKAEYIRFCVVDGDEKKANTRAYFKEEWL